ncbi:MAG: metabolite traffic protein EboE [Acidiferrobacterales bacterium]
MKLGAKGDCHLTYCTNIHAGETWAEIRGNLERYLPAVKRRVAPHEDFGVGLRLSGIAAQALREQAVLEELRSFLHTNELYIFTINGFPYGTFHRARVKEEVYLPDWQQDERLDYTNLLADLLAELLPPETVRHGSVSTVPGAFKPRAASDEAVTRIASQIIRHVAHLVRLRENTGRTIALALEPEPCCLLETVEETIQFFQNYLFTRAAVRQLAALTGLQGDAVEEALQRHVGVCLDLCHAAVEFEDPRTIVQRLKDAGIRVAKMQISAGLRVPNVTADSNRPLRAFDDAVYLHQVVERIDSQLKRYVDLPEAMAQLPANGNQREWRIHFHVPIFLEELGVFASTQSFLREILAQHRAEAVSQHLEVETYTWDVLPEQYRREGVVPAVVRELNWVRDQLQGP